MIGIPKFNYPSQESPVETKAKNVKIESNKTDKEKDVKNLEDKETYKDKEQKKTKFTQKERKKTEDSSSESEGCDGPISDEELAEASLELDVGLCVSTVDHNSFLPASWDDDLMPDTFLSGKKRHHKRNIIIEGSCNYFFWMEKIAGVRYGLLLLILN